MDGSDDRLSASRKPITRKLTAVNEKDTGLAQAACGRDGFFLPVKVQPVSRKRALHGRWQGKAARET